MSDFAYLICSCDKYHETWDAHLTLLKEFWPDFDFTVYLNTENLKYSSKLYKVQVVNNNNTKSWSERLYNCLRHIPNEVILLTLDDYFLIDEVDDQEIKKIVDYMKQHKEVAHASIISGDLRGGVRRPLSDMPGWLAKDDKEDWKISLQAGIWRKSVLIELLRRHENPWQFEIYGKERAKHRKDLFVFKCDSDGSIFPYDVKKYGLVKGYWTQETPDYLKEFGIEIDYNNLGIVTTDNPYEEAYRTGEMVSLRRSFPKGIIKKCFWIEVFRRTSVWFKSCVFQSFFRFKV